MNWNITEPDRERIVFCARRASLRAADTGHVYMVTDAIVDLTAAHANHCPLRLEDLSLASDVDFMHDLLGIRTNIDRHTGRLLNGFWPRHARSQAAPEGIQLP